VCEDEVLILVCGGDAYWNLRSTLGARSMGKRVVRAGYYWPTIQTD